MYIDADADADVDVDGHVQLTSMCIGANSWKGAWLDNRQMSISDTTIWRTPQAIGVVFSLSMAVV